MATNRVYQLWEPIWRKLLDCYEGAGGFLDGAYIAAHPREWDDHALPVPKIASKKLKERRALACYEPIATAIVDEKRAALFREEVVRTVGASDKAKPHGLEVWWENVDGKGSSIDDYMSSAWAPAAVMGHAVLVMDRTPPDGAAVTAADEKAPYLTAYTALDLVDWRQKNGELTAVKLLESVESQDIKAPNDVATAIRTRYITSTDWETEVNGTHEKGGPHGFGALPVVLLYATRRTGDVVGRSVLGDPRLYIDLFNLTSELRELLRKQTFSMFNAPLGTGDTAVSVENAKTMLGTETGTASVLFSPLPMQVLTADTSNVKAYQDERAARIRTIYRACAVHFESDSNDAEAAGSISLKREAMNQTLASYADFCEESEYAIAKLWYRATYGANWQTQWDADNVVIRYPDTFETTPFEELLQQAQAADGMGFGPQFMAELQIRLLAKFLPDAPQDVVDKLKEEITERVTQQADMEQKRQSGELAMLTGAAAAGKVTPPRPGKVAA